MKYRTYNIYNYVYDKHGASFYSDVEFVNSPIRASLSGKKKRKEVVPVSAPSSSKGPAEAKAPAYEDLLDLGAVGSGGSDGGAGVDDHQALVRGDGVLRVCLTVGGLAFWARPKEEQQGQTAQNEGSPGFHAVAACPQSRPDATGDRCALCS